jgi:hypothetical protein
MKNQRPAVVQRDDQVLASPLGLDEAASPQASGEGARAWLADDVWGGDDHAVNALAEGSSPKVSQLGFYFRKLGHRLDGLQSGFANEDTD